MRRPSHITNAPNSHWVNESYQFNVVESHQVPHIQNGRKSHLWIAHSLVQGPEQTPLGAPNDSGSYWQTSIMGINEYDED
jgi:hypothetical protein